ncbi:hypothetical protein SUGI_0381450 [Cryptomeria japonica]|nr:hypothetical protein SUGI_0381450 [Cryptomeria japonica]
MDFRVKGLWVFLIFLFLANHISGLDQVYKKTPLTDCGDRCDAAFHTMLPKDPVPPSGPSPFQNYDPLSEEMHNR